MTPKARARIAAMSIGVRAAGRYGELDHYGYCAWCYEIGFDPALGADRE